MNEASPHASGTSASGPLSDSQIRLMRLAGAASVSVALTLIVLKLWAWTTTGSVALLGSLADSLLDLIASLITFFAVRVATEPADREHRFGHGKSEAVAGLLQALIVSGSAFYVGFRAVVRLLSPIQISEPGIGVAIMSVSLLLTIALIVFQRYVVNTTGSIAINADAMHYKADVLTNIAVIIAIALNFYLAWYAADPLLGMLIVVLILISVRTILGGALDVLLDRELPAAARAMVNEIACAHPAVLGLHDVRTRSSGRAQFIQLHLELDPQLTLEAAHEISDAVEARLQREFPRAEVIIHADPYGLAETRDSWGLD